MTRVCYPSIETNRGMPSKNPQIGLSSGQKVFSPAGFFPTASSNSPQPCDPLNKPFFKRIIEPGRLEPFDNEGKGLIARRLGCLYRHVADIYCSSKGCGERRQLYEKAPKMPSSLVGTPTLSPLLRASSHSSAIPSLCEIS